MAKHNTKTYGESVEAQKAKEKASVSKQPGRMKAWVSKFGPIAVLLCGLLFVASRLIGLESEVLFKSQEMSLWVPGETYYNHFNIYPGGWLSWVGCYMTQFFFNPATGVYLLMLAWAAIMALLACVYRLRGWKLLTTALVPMMLLAALTQTGYWVYYQKLPGHMWVPTLGILFSLAGAIIYKWLRDNVFVIKTMKNGEEIETKGSAIARTVRQIMSLLWMAAFAWYGYQLMGAWSFAGLAIMASITVKPAHLSRAKSMVVAVIPVLVAALLIVLVPKIACTTIFEQTKDTEIYTAGLPCFSYMSANVVIYRHAYYLLAAAFLPMVLLSRIPEEKWQLKRNRWVASLLLCILLAMSANFVSGRWNRDKNFHAEIAMTNAVNRFDWEGALKPMRELANDTIEPTRAMVMMKNLALFRLGRFGEEFLQYPEGARQQNVDEWYKYGESMYDIPAELDTIQDADERERAKMEYKWNIRLSQIAGKIAYLNYGKLNYCYRWCMEDAVEFGWHVDGLKMMALCCLLKGEDMATHKYLNILKRTRYHREWAEKYEALIGKPEEIKKQPEFSAICYLKEITNRLDGDNTLIELYLLKTFANGNGVDPIYQEMTLNSALLMKDIDLFWPRFMQYATIHSKEPNFRMPRYYQEAAYLYGHLENKVDISQMPFDQSVKDSYQRFMDFNGLPNIAPLSEEQKAKEFKPQFGNTFYYFYFLVRNQKTN